MDNHEQALKAAHKTISRLRWTVGICIFIIIALAGANSEDKKSDSQPSNVQVQNLVSGATTDTNKLESSSLVEEQKQKAPLLKSKKKKAVVSSYQEDYSSSAYDGRCNATTKKGNRCKRSSRSAGYCWQHGG